MGAVAASAAPEADPAIVYSGLGYGGLYGGLYGGYGGLYGYGTHRLTYGLPAYTAPVVTSGVTHYIGKREAEPKAEAEADPAVFYSGLGYGHGLYGYGHSGYGLGYRSAYGLAHTGYVRPYAGYTYGHYIGKRSADAEPAADADADAYYGYYGRGYGYGHYGYGGYRGYYGRGYY